MNIICAAGGASISNWSDSRRPSKTDGRRYTSPLPVFQTIQSGPTIKQKYGTEIIFRQNLTFSLQQRPPTQFRRLALLLGIMG